MNKLIPELIPSNTWYNNVRSIVSKDEWDIIRRKSYKFANYKCQICEDSGINQGYKHPVECHEIWEFDDKNKIQYLTGFISLCPLCHKCKHPGLAEINGEIDLVIKQLMKVNNISLNKANKLLDEAIILWRERCKIDYTVNVAYIHEYLES